MCLLWLLHVLITTNFDVKQGGGTREGTGKCKCNDGYDGDKCTQCANGHYEERNGAKLTCKGRALLMTLSTGHSSFILINSTSPKLTL